MSLFRAFAHNAFLWLVYEAAVYGANFYGWQEKGTPALVMLKANAVKNNFVICVT